VGSIKYLVTAESIPDTILPSQFFESVGAQTFSSEKRLMLAVLADAINLLRSSNLRRRNSFNEAWSWVFANRINRRAVIRSRVRRTRVGRRESAKAPVGVGFRARHQFS